MNEWSVVTVIIALVGLFFTVGKPIINLNNNIVALNANMERNNARLDKHDKALSEQAKHARDSHQKLWDHNKVQDDKLNDHETRISVLEQK